MSALQTVFEQAFGWVIVAALLLVPGVVATLLWAPFLASSRLRALFEQLPPFESVVVTYAVVGVGASLPFVCGLVAVLATVDPDAIWGPPILGLTVVLSLCYVVAIPVVGAVGLPRLGIDWDPNSYDASTWAVLAAGGIWYTALFAVPFAILGLVLSLPGGY